MGWHWGVLASSGGGAAGAYELISTTVLATTTTTVNFASIPSTYKHLQLRYTARMNGSASTQGFAIQFNATGGTSYAWHQLIGNGSSVSSEGATSTPYSIIGRTPANGQAFNIFAAGVVDILDYASTTKNKTIRGLSGFHGDVASRIILGSGLFASTSAVTSLLVTRDSADFVAGSRFSLYGVLG